MVQTWAVEAWIPEHQTLTPAQVKAVCDTIGPVAQQKLFEILGHIPTVTIRPEPVGITDASAT